MKNNSVRSVDEGRISAMKYCHKGKERRTIHGIQMDKFGMQE